MERKKSHIEESMEESRICMQVKEEPEFVIPDDNNDLSILREVYGEVKQEYEPNLEQQNEILMETQAITPPAPIEEAAAGQDNASGGQLKWKIYEHFIVRLCPFCGTGFTRKVDWSSHLYSDHNFQQLFGESYTELAEVVAQCNTCGMINENRRGVLQEHFLSHQPYVSFLKCRLCSNVNHDNILTLRKHLEDQHGAKIKLREALVNRNNSCIYCGSHIRTEYKLSLHYLETHKELDDKKILHVCPRCGFEYSNKQDWQAHCIQEHALNNLSKLSMRQIDSGNHKAYACSRCPIILKSSALLNLLYHASSHMAYSVFKCRYCSEELQHTFDMRAHICEELKTIIQIKGPPRSNENIPSIQIVPQLTDVMKMISVRGKEPKDEKLGEQKHLNFSHGKTTVDNVNIVEISDDSDEGEQQLNSLVEAKFQTKFKHERQMPPQNQHKINETIENICKLNQQDDRSQGCSNPSESLTSSQPTPEMHIHNGTTKSKSKSKSFEQYIKSACPACGKPFQLLEEFTKHAAEAHENFKNLNDLNIAKMQEGQNASRFKCLLCGHKFEQNALSLLQQHAFTHMPHKIYTCTLCGLGLETKPAMTMHLEREFAVQAVRSAESKFDKFVRYYCPVCNQQLNTNTAYTQHLNEKHQLGTLKSLRMKEVHNVTQWQAKLVCLDCGQVARNPALPQLLAHRIAHLPYKPYECLYCHKKLANVSSVLSHARICKQKDVAETSSNTKNSKEMENAKTPSNTKKTKQIEVAAPPTNTNIYKQIVLGNTTTHTKKSKQIKLGGTLTHSTVSDVEEEGDPLQLKQLKTGSTEIYKPRTSHGSECGTLLKEYNEYMTYACPECNERLATQQEWNTHISLIHDFFDELKLNFASTANGKARCKECGVITDKTITHKQRHKLTHLPYKSFICTLCNHRSNTIFLLGAHLDRCHFTVGEFKCFVCGLVLETNYKRQLHCQHEHTEAEYPETICTICMKLLRTKEALRVHMEVHEHERKVFNCFLCGRNYMSSTELKKHSLFKHAEFIEKYTIDYAYCLICFKVFKNRIDLEEHIKTHEGETFQLDPFVCKLCHYGAKTDNALRVHIKIKHTPAERTRYECKYCDKSYTNKCNLVSHCARWHPDIENPTIFREPKKRIFTRQKKIKSKNDKEIHRRTTTISQPIRSGKRGRPRKRPPSTESPEFEVVYEESVDVKMEATYSESQPWQIGADGETTAIGTPLERVEFRSLSSYECDVTFKESINVKVEADDSESQVWQQDDEEEEIALIGASDGRVESPSLSSYECEVVLEENVKIKEEANDSEKQIWPWKEKKITPTIESPRKRGRPRKRQLSTSSSEDEINLEKSVSEKTEAANSESQHWQNEKDDESDSIRGPRKRGRSRKRFLSTSSSESDITHEENVKVLTLTANDEGHFRQREEEQG